LARQADELPTSRQGLGDEFDVALRADHSTVRVVCPFIKRGAAELLLRPGVPDSIQVITRFDLGQMSEGVSDNWAETPAYKRVWSKGLARAKTPEFANLCRPIGYRDWLRYPMAHGGRET
jgi:hypothetical protein